MDTYSQAAHAVATTFGRCPDGIGAFVTTATSTKGAVNDCPADDVSAIKFNEVESNGDAVGDWAELKNTGATPVDISGLKFKDSDDAHAFYVVPAGTTVAPGGYYVLDEAAVRLRAGCAPTTVRLFLADGPRWSTPTPGPRTRRRRTAAAPTAPAPSRRRRHPRRARPTTARRS